MKSGKYLILIGLLFFILGCEMININETENEIKGNCTSFECIEIIESNNSVEEVNEIIGFNGELIDETYNKYYWELSDTQGVTITYYSGDYGTITIDFDRDTIANKNVNFSKYDEIKSLLDSGDSLSYQKFVSLVGGVDGTLIEKSRFTNKYTWVNSDGGYLNASFSNSTGKCTIVVGHF